MTTLESRLTHFSFSLVCQAHCPKTLATNTTALAQYTNQHNEEKSFLSFYFCIFKLCDIHE